MGKLTEALQKKKAKKQKQKEPKQPRAKTRMNAPSPPKEEQTFVDPDILSLKVEARTVHNHFATITYEKAMRTCHWCCKLEDNMYDLGFASPYGKCKFCSEECQRKWYAWAGKKVKRSDQSIDEYLEEQT